MTLHALVHREKARLSRSTIGESSRTAEESFSRDHIYSARDEAHTTFVHVDVQVHGPKRRRRHFTNSFTSTPNYNSRVGGRGSINILLLFKTFV